MFKILYLHLPYIKKFNEYMCFFKDYNFLIGFWNILIYNRSYLPTTAEINIHKVVFCFKEVIIHRHLY